MKIRITSYLRSATIAAVLLCSLIVPASANIIAVTNTNDSGAGSLRQALAVANNGDEITFAVTGTIGLTSGELLVSHSVTISGPGAASLAVDANTNFRVFHVASGTIVTISGLTIINGNANGQSYPDDSGGALYNDHATATLSNCTINNNSAFTFGGAIYNDHATLTVNNCGLDNNFSDNTGGAIYNDGSSGSATATINDSTLTSGFAYGGGAIYNNGDSGTATLAVTTSALNGNSTILDGGAIYNDHGDVTLNSCTIGGNTADGNGGGGIFNLGDSLGTATVTISSSTLNNNESAFNGGDTAAAVGRDIGADGAVEKVIITPLQAMQLCRLRTARSPRTWLKHPWEKASIISTRLGWATQ